MCFFISDQDTQKCFLTSKKCDLNDAEKNKCPCLTAYEIGYSSGREAGYNEGYGVKSYEEERERLV